MGGESDTYGYREPVLGIQGQTWDILARTKGERFNHSCFEDDRQESQLKNGMAAERPEEKEK